MKKFIKEVFIPETQSTNYKSAIKNYIVTMVIAIALFLLFNLIPIGNPFRYLLIIPIGLIMWISFMFFVKLSIIYDNIQKEKLKNKKYKFRYDPITVNIDDFKFWLENAEMPETLYLKSQTDNNYIFEVGFDITGKNGKFINKKFYLDDKEINSANDCIDLLLSLDIIINNQIKVYETFDHNKPEVLLDVIKDLKEMR